MTIFQINIHKYFEAMAVFLLLSVLKQLNLLIEKMTPISRSFFFKQVKKCHQKK